MKKQFRNIEQLNNDLKNRPSCYWAKKFATRVCIPTANSMATLCGSSAALLGNNYAIFKVEEGCEICQDCADILLNHEPINELRQYLDDGYMTAEKAILINALLRIQSGSLSELMSICITDEKDRNKIDTAYPTDYANAIRELLPNWNGSFNVYDYRKQIFGEMTNIAEEFTKVLVETFKK